MKVLLTVLIIFSVFMCGCALMDKVVPPQYDEEGVAIPGSRQASPITQAVADTVPYGNVVLNVLLLAYAGAEKFKAYKLNKGLKATLLAGKQVAKDPQMAKMWEKIKEAYYRPAHESAGVTNLVKAILASIPKV